MVTKQIMQYEKRTGTGRVLDTARYPEALRDILNTARVFGYYNNSTPTNRPVVSASEVRELFNFDEIGIRLGGGSVFLEALCKEHPVAAFEIATDILNQVAATASAMVEESGQALALIEARSERIDRLQAENRKLLDALVVGRAS